MDFPFSGLAKDVLAVIGNWPRWKELGKAPERIDELEKRVAELEALLARCPGEGCPSCGAREFRAVSSKAGGTFREQRDGRRDTHMKCGACGFEDVVVRR